MVPKLGVVVSVSKCNNLLIVEFSCGDDSERNDPNNDLVDDFPPLQVVDDGIGLTGVVVCVGSSFVGDGEYGSSLSSDCVFCAEKEK